MLRGAWASLSTTCPGVPAGGPMEGRAPQRGRRDVASPSVAGSRGRWQPTGQLGRSVWVTGAAWSWRPDKWQGTSSSKGQPPGLWRQTQQSQHTKFLASTEVLPPHGSPPQGWASRTWVLGFIKSCYLWACLGHSLAPFLIRSDTGQQGWGSWHPMSREAGSPGLPCRARVSTAPSSSPPRIREAMCDTGH